jgi:NAD(P)H-dependent flavin oxidoreductase YrpB (nitropropane dioxygenase family)
MKTLKPLILGDLEIKIPIIQGAMGVQVSTAPLAAAVANTGAAGTIAGVCLGFGNPENETNFIKASREALAKEIREAKKLTSGVVGVNVLVATNNYEDLIKTAINEKVDFIASGAGLPLKLPALTKESKTKLLPIVSSGRAASIIINTWNKHYNKIPDGIIVEGPLAGGHLGFHLKDIQEGKIENLEKITKDVLEVVKDYNIPVIPAGGIFDGTDIAKFLKLGASGVQIASRFVATNECSISNEFKKLYIASKKEDITYIKSPVGMPGRVIKTKFSEFINKGGRENFKCAYKCLKTCDVTTAPFCIAKALCNAVIGNIDEAIVFAGQNAYRINKIVPVKELINELVRETLLCF